MMRFLSVCE